MKYMCLGSIKTMKANDPSMQICSLNILGIPTKYTISLRKKAHSKQLIHIDCRT